jgi:hypothetical protein
MRLTTDRKLFRPPASVPSVPVDLDLMEKLLGQRRPVEVLEVGLLYTWSAV